ncbi:PspA/IM30 family protein [Spartinivicinus poritis]|uniref:PspA/IM30 family protein n=1 Tax=Spartinivicinus poritis TaxID=2994640 RepID=A0ABT5UAZ5_9GAMM|nr:PspA/IM30 family protein [Spartinivicinus sp. A2-2]MDE1463540.1 PspA/IM30 family protein [Spartinivicinus sp. A2-2]
MSVLQKILAVIRGKVREIAEPMIDGNAIRTYQQELVSAEAGLTQVKHYLRLVMAERIQLESSCQLLKHQLAKSEQQALEALNKGEESLAIDIAATIVEIESSLANQQNHIVQLQAKETKLTQQTKAVAQQIREFSLQLQLIQATDYAHQAFRLVSHYTEGISSNFSQLQASLSTIKQQQQYFEAFDEARASLEITNTANEKQAP